MLIEDHTHAYLRTHRLRGDVLTFRLGDEDAALRQQADSASDGRAAKTLVKAGPFRITLVAMTRGTMLQCHEVAGPCSLQAVRGHLRVTTSDGDADLTPGGLIALDAGVAHTVRAVDDGALLITIAMP